MDVLTSDDFDRGPSGVKIGTSVTSPTENGRAIFGCLRPSGIKLEALTVLNLQTDGHTGKIRNGTC